MFFRGSVRAIHSLRFLTTGRMNSPLLQDQHLGTKYKKQHTINRFISFHKNTPSPEGEGWDEGKNKEARTYETINIFKAT